jgi:hypothetical protein
MIKTPLKMITLSAAATLFISAASAQEVQQKEPAVVDTPQIAKNTKDVYTLKLVIAKLIQRFEGIESKIKMDQPLKNSVLPQQGQTTTLKEVLYVIGKDLKDKNGEPVLDPELKQIILEKIKTIDTAVNEIDEVLSSSVDGQAINDAVKKDKFEKDFGQKLPDREEIFSSEQNRSEVQEKSLKEHLENNISALKQELNETKDKLMEKANTVYQEGSKKAGELYEEGSKKVDELTKKANEIKNNLSNSIEEKKDDVIKLFPGGGTKDEVKDSNTSSSVVPTNTDKIWSEAKKMYPLLPEEETFNPKRAYGYADDKKYNEYDIVKSYKDFGKTKKYVIAQKPATKVFDKPVLISWGSKVVDSLNANEVVDVDLFTESGWLHVKGKGWIKGYFAEEKQI